MKNIRWFISLFVLFGMLLAPVQSATALSTQSPEQVAVTPEAVEAFLNDFSSVYMEELDVPGLAFVMVKDGSVFVSKGYGFADVENQVPFDPEQTIVRAGSIVKTVTALALVQLAEQGEIDLDADVNQYLTHFQIPDTFNEPITARQLLHYTAGLDNRFIGIRVETQDEILPLSEYFAQRLPDRVRPPGEIRAYNDHEIALAGLLVEEVSGMPYNQYVQEYIFKPLGMDSSSIYLPESDVERAAVGYGSNGAYPLNYYNLNDAAGSGFNTTPADLARYMLMHLQNVKLDGKQVFSESVIKELHTTRFTHHPKLPGIAYAFDETFWGGRRILAKGGGAPGFTNRMLLLLDEGVGIYFVYNRDSTVPLSWKLEQAFLEHFYPKGEPSVGEEVPATDPGKMARYTGYYISLNDYSATSIEKVQALMEQEQVTLDEQGRLQYAGGTLLRMDKNLFQWSESGNYVAFGEDEAGKVNYLFVSRTALMRVPWIETFPVQMGLLGFSLIVFFTALIGWLVMAFKRQGKSYALSGSVSLIYIGFLVGMGLLLAPVFAGADPPWALSFAPPTALLVLLALPLVGIAVTLLLAWQVIRSWKERRFGWFVRIHNTLILVASLSFLFFLHTWNLLGYQL
ncbi:MAG: serine hydrolase [Anaerolineales bacterium]|jgi:CubicO group peptidase (beta-lactamase class C family)